MAKLAVTNVYPDAKATRYDNGRWYIFSGGKCLGFGKTPAAAWKAAHFKMALA
jgi:hypothetical protein